MDRLLRDEVRWRAEERCEYCRIPQAFDPIPYHLDHTIAQKHRGSTTSPNMAWSRFACNNQKQSDIAGIDPDGSPDDRIRLFHPRKDVWVSGSALEGVWVCLMGGAGRCM